ncbi:tripartite tricarboxylate transporter TctB family protein [Rhodobacterales bacterium]|nr:tripartite tricarboxylate transporter TctB family protein [Rhodobacterales bacterium]
MTAQWQDMLLGAAFAVTGAAAAFKAAAYPGASGGYPMVLGLMLAGLGALVSLKAVKAGETAERPLTENTPRMVLTLVCGALYLALVPVLGFYTASALVVLALPVVLGFRRPVYLGAVTIVFIGIVWSVFSLLLEKPLPAEIWMRF